jgi:hypothetical protein
LESFTQLGFAPVDPAMQDNGSVLLPQAGGETGCSPARVSDERCGGDVAIQENGFKE